VVFRQRNVPARPGVLHWNCIVHALKAHYRRMGSGLYFRWNTGMEITTAEQSAYRLIRHHAIEVMLDDLCQS
jgi:hypothetical protein